MFRVLVLASLVVLVGLATPAAAWEAHARDCAHTGLAFTESDDAHVDFYVSEVVDYQADPSVLDTAYVTATLLGAIQRAEQAFFEPGKVSRGDMVVQLEFQSPHSDDPAVTGVRFTYQVNVNACSGI